MIKKSTYEVIPITQIDTAVAIAFDTLTATFTSLDPPERFELLQPLSLHHIQAMSDEGGGLEIYDKEPTLTPIFGIEVPEDFITVKNEFYGLFFPNGFIIEVKEYFSGYVKIAYTTRIK